MFAVLVAQYPRKTRAKGKRILVLVLKPVLVLVLIEAFLS
jgi:hypothetical protein